MNLEDLKQQFHEHVKDLQNQITHRMQNLDKELKLIEDLWNRNDHLGNPGGGGITRAFEGSLFENAGVNTSCVFGKIDPQYAKVLKGSGDEMWATGISLIIHPVNPRVPTVHALESGKIYGCAGDARISAAPREDYAQAAVKILLTKASGKNIYELAGDKSFTLTEFAQTLTRLSGKPVNYVNLKEEEYAHLLNQAGLPVGFANMLAETESKAQKGWLEFKEPTISKIIGHQTTPLDEAIRSSL